MARYIHCETCKDKMVRSAMKFDELYEFLEGTAIRTLCCDGVCSSTGQPRIINPGDKCYAAVLLNNRSHPNYPIQRPEAWAHEFINITPKSSQQANTVQNEA